MRLLLLHHLFFAAWLGTLLLPSRTLAAAPETQPTISVVTLNLYHDRADWPKRRVQIAETLRALRPDVVLLQEVLQHEKLQNQAEWLAGEIGYAAHFVSVDPADRVHRYGNAILTPHPILQRDQLALEPRSDSRTAGMLRLEVRGEAINLYVTHLHHTGEGVALRERQVADLVAFIHRTAGEVPSLVGGDFNTVANAPEIAALTERFVDSFGTLHPHAGPETTTLNRAFFDQPRRIDHIFFERDRFEPLHSEILFTKPDANGTWASDHHGVLSRFAVVKSPNRPRAVRAAGAADPAPADAAAGFVTYEQFGAVGDGATDDLPAIVQAHAFANERGWPVRSNPQATYHLGRRALTAMIETDTDWSTSRFIIDDSQGVENHKLPLFEVRSRLAPVPLQLARLSAGQERLDVHPATDLLVLVENSQRRRFIRRGLNANDGTPQHEVFILRKDGSIEGAIEWDYDALTRVEARPIDAAPLTLRGGVFTNRGNRMQQPKGYNYWARNIRISRSNTIVDGIASRVVDEGEFGHPYSGFLHAVQVANITFRNCRIDPRKVYKTIGAAGEPVSMGTYGYRADLVVNFAMQHCRMEAIHDTSRWGVAATNFMKNVLLEDCVLSRMDVHQGVSGAYTIRRSTLGYMGIKAIGRGRLEVEDSTVHCENFITFRSDYGATWDGDVSIRNCRWVPPAKPGRTPAMFSVSNDGTHDFGYACAMPRVIRIDGLTVDDAAAKGVAYFDNPRGALGDRAPFPYRPTERVEVRGLKTASGQPPSLSVHAEIEKALPVRLDITP